MRSLLLLSCLGSMACGAATGDPPTAGSGSAAGGAETGMGGSPEGMGGMPSPSFGGAPGTPSGGTSGGTGIPVEPLDCPSNPLQATGSIDGIPISSGSPHFPGFSPGNYWKTAQLFGEFQVWAWGTEFVPAPTGTGHAKRGDTHYCVGGIGASVPFNGTIAYSSFSKIGSCAAAGGSSGTLKFCKGCNGQDAHLWGSVGPRNVDHTGDMGEIPGLFTTFEAFGVGALVFLEKSVPWGDLDHGFVRTEINGEQVTYCVKDVSDLSDDSADHFELQVTELGTCPGTPVSGSLKGCL